MGLGNPGKEYENTRHNAGAWFVQQLSPAPLKSTPKLKGALLKTSIADEEVILFLPETFMNESGEAVQKVSQFYKIKPAEILIIHDELDLAAGTARFKYGGGDGGHNGLKSITRFLGTQQYTRLRIGIGHPGDRAKVYNFVLSKPQKEEENAIYDAIREANQSLKWVLEGDLERAMRELH